MAPNPPIQAKKQLPGLAKRLISDGVLTAVDAEAAVEEALNRHVSLVQYLVAKKLADSLAIAISTCKQFGIPLIDLDAVDTKEAASLVPEKLQTDHRAIPLFKRGNNLFIAVSDPTDQQGIEVIRFNTKLAPHMVLVEESKLALILDKGQDTGVASAAVAVTDTEIEGISISSDEDASNKTGDIDLKEDDAPIVRFVNKILVDAINYGASDIHFEPYEKTFRIRFRQDGILNEFASPSPKLSGRVSSRLKVMSRMNIAERRVPQDGKIRLKYGKRDVDFRVNTMPTLHGEKVVLRILDASTAKAGIDKLGFNKEQMAAFLKAIHKPYGLILVTGPTGSGKTVSLYSALNILNEPTVNISTAEDPVEIQVPGINQVNVSAGGGVTFAQALKAFLRQDPDVIMVGEIRDLETAEIAVKAAQTGHLVLSTLHTNDAPQTLTRLANMGVPPFNIASAVLLIMAQRLARRLCENCKAEDKIPDEVLFKEGFTKQELREGLVLYKPVGCSECKGGYRGRVGLFQVMPISEDMARIVMKGGTSYELGDQAAKEGILNLRQSGLDKVRDGITSLKEVNRVTTA